jgi:hypothetical protein
MLYRRDSVDGERMRMGMKIRMGMRIRIRKVWVSRPRGWMPVIRNRLRGIMRIWGGGSRLGLGQRILGLNHWVSLSFLFHFFVLVGILIDGYG